MERESYLASMPAWLLAESPILSILVGLKLDQQLDLIWPSLTDGQSPLWAKLSVLMKLICIFRAAHDRYVPSTLRGAAANPEHEHPLVQFGLGVLLLLEKPERDSAGS